MRSVHVNMLGEFTISSDSTKITDRGNRSKKVWLLLAYMIFNRHRVLKPNELISALWSKTEQDINLQSALKALLFRARATLDALWPSAGMELIVRRSGGYIWNDEVETVVDIDLFEKLCNTPHDDSIMWEEALREGIDMFSDDFLSGLSSELWVIPISVYYHNLYLRSVLELIPVLVDGRNFSAAADVCHEATRVEPYNEEIYRYYMRSLIAIEERKKAAEVYKQLSDLLYDNFGIVPEEETRAIYYEATKTNNEKAVPIEMLHAQLQEEGPDGALICEYDFFRILYRYLVRSMARSGIAAHIVLLSVGGRFGADISRKRLDGAMLNLEDAIRYSLRRGDSAAKCSVSQFVVLLPGANYENSKMVFERIERAYFRKHPHSEVDIKCDVYPLQPDAKEEAIWRRIQEQG